MENKEIVRILSETADLMEIDNQDAFRIRSYRNAAQAIQNLAEPVEQILTDPARKLTDIPSIGKGMAAHLEELCQRGEMTTHQELLSRYPPAALAMLQIQGLGPKGVATLLQHFQIKSLDDVE